LHTPPLQRAATTPADEQRIPQPPQFIASPVDVDLAAVVCLFRSQSRKPASQFRCHRARRHVGSYVVSRHARAMPQLPELR